MTEVAKELDKILNDLHFKGGMWNSKGELSPSTHASNDPCVVQAKTAILALLEKQDIKSRIDELDKLKRWGWGTDFNGQALTHTNRTPEDILARIEHRENSLSQSPVGGKE